VLGWQDETWWSRLKQPLLHTWDDQPLRLVEQTVAKRDPDPKALACYGLLRDDTGRVLLRFVDGQPCSAATIAFLDWCCQQLAAEGKQGLLLVWDNASWHLSYAVRDWLRAHNRQVKREGKGVRIVSCFLPIKSPWLNPIEPYWVHGKRAVVEPARLLTAQELTDRVHAHFDCTPQPQIVIPELAA
jgi:transposase